MSWTRTPRRVVLALLPAALLLMTGCVSVHQQPSDRGSHDPAAYPVDGKRAQRPDGGLASDSGGTDPSASASTGEPETAEPDDGASSMPQDATEPGAHSDPGSTDRTGQAEATPARDRPSPTEPTPGPSSPGPGPTSSSPAPSTSPSTSPDPSGDLAGATG